MRIFYFCFEGFKKIGKLNNHIRETVSWLAKFGHDVHFFNIFITGYNQKIKLKFNRILYGN